MQSDPERCVGELLIDRQNCALDEDPALNPTRFKGYLACSSCLESMAFNDELTQLPNRLYMKLAFKEAIASGQPFGAIAIDLRNYKLVNNRLGHQEGDEILHRTAEFLQNSVRETDETIARRGGDEFALLLRLVDRHGEPTQNPQQRLVEVGKRLENDYADYEPVREYNSGLSVLQRKKKLGLRFGYEVWDGKMTLGELLDRADTKGNGSRRKSSAHRRTF